MIGSEGAAHVARHESSVSRVATQSKSFFVSWKAACLLTAVVARRVFLEAVEFCPRARRLNAIIAEFPDVLILVSQEYSSL